MKKSCFGIPSVFNGDADSCRSCVERNGCISECRKRIDSWSIPCRGFASQFGVRVKAEYRELTEHEEAIVSFLPKKMGPRYRSLVSRGFADLSLGEIAKGEHPTLDSNGKYLSVACRSLIEGEGQVTKQELRKRFMKEFSWTKETAASFVSVCISLLCAVHLIDATRDKLIVTPKLRVQN